MVFIQFVNVMYHIYCFAYIELFPHTGDKSFLVCMNDLSYVLLDSISKNFEEDFCIYFNQWYYSAYIFLYCIFFSGFGMEVILVSSRRPEVRRLELFSCLSQGFSGPSIWAILCCYPKHISRELNQFEALML